MLTLTNKQRQKHYFLNCFYSWLIIALLIHMGVLFLHFNALPTPLANLRMNRQHTEIQLSANNLAPTQAKIISNQQNQGVMLEQTSTNAYKNSLPKAKTQPPLPKKAALSLSLQAPKDAIPTSKALSKQAKTRTISAASVKGRDAAYLAYWENRLETLGNQLFQKTPNVPQGKLQLMVTLNLDGTLANVNILTSSGNPTLDKLAITTVQKAAPFSPLPAQMREKTKALAIIRTWEYN